MGDRASFQQRFILALISLLTLVSILTVHISVNAVQPSAVLITNSYNFANRGLGVRREGGVRLEAVSNGKTQLKVFRDVLIVEGDKRSWAALVHVLGQKPLQYGGFIMKTLAGSTPSQYWFSCRAKGNFLMAWRQGGKDRACGEGLRLLYRGDQAKSSLKSNFKEITQVKTPLLIAQEALDEITIVPGTQSTLIQTVDSGASLTIKVITGTIQVTSTKFSQSQLLQKNQQYNYSQNQITSFDADSAWQSQEVKDFLQDQQWITPDTPKALSESIRNQLQSYRSETSATASEKPQITEIQQAILDTHNQLRAEVGTPPLSWSGELASYAQEWANQLSRENGFRHRDGGSSGAGENLTAGSSITQMLDMWASEKDDYNPSTNTCRQGRVCGHYTQMVWRSTTEIGCGIASHKTYGNVMVCNYRPPGNYIGQRPY